MMSRNRKIVDAIPLVVVGAHMSGMPLNHELTAIGAKLACSTTTTPDYNLFALTDIDPAKPGLLRVGPDSGKEIEVEVWSLAPASFASFVAAIPSPLGIGTISLAGGGASKGFLVESIAVEAAENITRFGGWRSYVERRATRGFDRSA